MGSSHHSEDPLSAFFDFGSPVQDSLEYKQTTTTPNPEAPSRGGVRVSLACVPCRSRHVKCGAEMPNCSRCLQDDKPCFYAKSRRGMRDRNAPKKRISMCEAGRRSPGPGSSIHSLNSLTYLGGTSSNGSWTGPSTDGSASPESSSSRLSMKPPSPTRLLDLYYSSFHKSHPFLLPRYYFHNRLLSDPESLKYLFPVTQWVGSMFSAEMASSDLRHAAMSLLEMVNLPPNGFTVQALLVAAIAVHAQDDTVKARAILDQAIYVALEIRMNSRTFANMERDPVLAESWRRTYWYLYITDAMFAGYRKEPHFMLYNIDANVELPCEECDYDGIIPRPRTLEDYEARVFEDVEPVFSSFTYLIDLTRIAGSLLALHRLPSKDIESAVGNADAMLVNWQLHLPREKRSVVDKNEEVDEVLFQAQSLLQILLILIHRPLSRLHHSALEVISSCAPPPMLHQPTGEEDKTCWIHTKKTLEAAEAVTNLYALPCHIANHTPLGVCGLTLATLANLSACSYVLSGPEWYRARDRVRLGLGGLKAFGEVWALGRRTEKETKMIARSIFTAVKPEVQGTIVDTGNVVFDMPMTVPTPASGGWQELSELDLMGTWNPFVAEQQQQQQQV